MPWQDGARDGSPPAQRRALLGPETRPATAHVSGIQSQVNLRRPMGPAARCWIARMRRWSAVTATSGAIARAHRDQRHQRGETIDIGAAPSQRRAPRAESRPINGFQALNHLATAPRAPARRSSIRIHQRDRRRRRARGSRRFCMILRNGSTAFVRAKMGKALPANRIQVTAGIAESIEQLTLRSTPRFGRQERIEDAHSSRSSLRDGSAVEEGSPELHGRSADPGRRRRIVCHARRSRVTDRGIRSR